MVRNEEDLTNLSGTKTSLKNTGKKLIPKTNRSVNYKDIILKFYKQMGKYNWRGETSKNSGSGENDTKEQNPRNKALLPPGITGSGAVR